MSDTPRTLLDAHQFNRLIAAILTASTVVPGSTAPEQVVQRYGQMVLRLQAEAKPDQD